MAGLASMPATQPEFTQATYVALDGTTSYRPVQTGGFAPTAPTASYTSVTRADPNDFERVTQERLQSMGLDMMNSYTPRPNTSYTVTEPMQNYPVTTSYVSYPAAPVVQNATITSYEATGYVQCDVFPNKAAVVYDNWSQCNFCQDVADLLKKEGSKKYFSKGTAAPKVRSAVGQPGFSEGVGIGIVLERRDADNIYVKRIAPDGAAAQDGRLQIGDMLRFVDGVPTAGLSHEQLTSVIVGPEGTTVELVVERNGQQEGLRIKRGGNASSAARPYVEPVKLKTYQELPFYLSEQDKKAAASEVAARIAQMRKNVGSGATEPGRATGAV